MHSVRAAFFLCISLFSASFFYFFYQRQISINILLISFFFSSPHFLHALFVIGRSFLSQLYIFDWPQRKKTNNNNNWGWLGSDRIFFCAFCLISASFFFSQRPSSIRGLFTLFFFQVSILVCAFRDLKVFFVSFIYFRLTAM